jgi:hypothetical protein
MKLSHLHYKPAAFSPRTQRIYMQLRTPTFIALALGMICSTVVSAAPPMDTECSVGHDYCGVWHDRVFHQYRQCCRDFACTAYDHLTRAVTDVVSFSPILQDNVAHLTVPAMQITVGVYRNLSWERLSSSADVSESREKMGQNYVTNSCEPSYDSM